MSSDNVEWGDTASIPRNGSGNGNGNGNGTSGSASQNRQDGTERMAEGFEQILSRLEIPPNIDPTILQVWIERERKVFEQKTEGKSLAAKNGVTLPRVLAAYIGVVSLLVVVLLGILRGQSADYVLIAACKTLLLYICVGYLAGHIAEYCVRESAIALAREVVRNSDFADSNTP